MTLCGCKGVAADGLPGHTCENELQDIVEGSTCVASEAVCGKWKLSTIGVKKAVLKGMATDSGAGAWLCAAWPSQASQIGSAVATHWYRGGASVSPETALSEAKSGDSCPGAGPCISRHHSSRGRSGSPDAHPRHLETQGPRCRARPRSPTRPDRGAGPLGALRASRVHGRPPAVADSRSCPPPALRDAMSRPSQPAGGAGGSGARARPPADTRGKCGNLLRLCHCHIAAMSLQ